MIPVRDAPIKRKLRLVILLATSLALLVMGGAVVTYELLTFRSSITTHTTVLSQIVGSMVTSSLAFDNKDDATEVINALSAEPQITAAAVYDNSGHIFAQYSNGGALVPPAPISDGSIFHHSELVIAHPITQKGVRLGTIYLRADLREMYSRLGIYGLLVVLAGATGIGGALVASIRLQRRISLPIIELATLARKVSAGQDYSVRAVRQGADEIGDLTEAFNQMLTGIGEARMALAGSEERRRLALEGSETGTWDIDLTTGKVIWDDYMYPLYGVEKEAFNGQLENAFRLVHPDDRAVVQAQIEAAKESREPFSIAFRIIHKGGDIRHISSRGRVFFSSDGTALRMSGMSMDVTSAKKAEEALQQAKESAEAANRAKDEFLAILSHEMRTPLTPVLATLALLEEDKSLPPELHRELEMIRRNVELEARLIDDLLDVTRVARGKLELHLQTLDFRSLLDHSIRNYLTSQAAQKHLTVTLEVDENACTIISADGSRITQVLWNLLQNACKFTPDNGSIVIKVFNELSGDDKDQTVLVATITDTGIGFGPDMGMRIFDAFEQGERSRTRMFGGLGLGLAISRAIAEMHGGALSASSQGHDCGATFTLRLPTVHDRSLRIPVEPASPKLLISASSTRCHILLVEDHRDTARQLARLLTREGHNVTSASNLSDAREFASTIPFDLLISDLGLPDGTGHELMEEFAGRYSFPGIALSGYGMEEDVKQSKAAGFARHLTKPVNWAELKAAIQALAGSRSQ